MLTQLTSCKAIGCNRFFTSSSYKSTKWSVHIRYTIEHNLPAFGETPEDVKKISSCERHFPQNVFAVHASSGIA